MSKNITSKCRLCGSRALTPVLSLDGNTNYVICDQEKDATACGLLQRAEPLTPPLMSKVPVSRTRRHRLRSVVTQSMEMVSTRDGRALDIGCGDGTLMSFLPRWIESYGIDQFDANDAVKTAGQYIQGQFPEKNTIDGLKKYIGSDQFDIITAISVLGQQQDPNEFLQNIRPLLAKDGVLIIETPYLSLALMRNNISGFNEEAQALYTLSSLEQLASKAGLKIIRGAMSETDGGSLRLFLCHADYTGHDYVPWLEQLAQLWDEENSLCLSQRQPYQAFLQRIGEIRRRAEAFMAELSRHGEHAHVLGTGPAMNTLLDSLEIGGEVISYAVSRDPNEYGETIEFHNCEIEILSEKESRLAKPDYYIAPAGMRREVLEHWREMIFDGVRIIFFTPELDIIDDCNYGAELGKALAVTDGPGSVDTLKAVLSTVRKPRLVAVNGRVQA